ncbi:DUF4190 domain-containing protein [Sulfurimonas sp. HSL3-2]|uniref:DUF4190 domain-containing protein n=1 Tax=Hydrocurvibacter mobilis TaxID=3131936 RepID=UPI0031F782BB
MRGKILDYTIQTGSGVISADDGQRYNFQASQWKTQNVHPAKNVVVDFTVEEGNAVEIYVIEQQQSKYDNTSVQTQETSVAAIISMIFGIGGLFFDWWFFAIPSVIAIITGHVARSNIKNSHGRLGGDGFAVAGLVLGYIVILLYLLIALFFVGVLASMSQMQ